VRRAQAATYRDLAAETGNSAGELRIRWPTEHATDPADVRGLSSRSAHKETDTMTDRPPTRIQRRRTRGWRAPDGAVYVGRGPGRTGRWGNPFVVVGDPAHAAALFRAWLDHGAPATLADRTSEERQELADRREWMRSHLAELAGRDLMCWCPLDQPCHADHLLAVANPTEEGEQPA
jgi:hypothetical protein